MALRAGYYGLKRRIRDKLYNLLDAVPAGIGPDNPIASKSDVLTAVDLLDDTVGWIGGNLLPNKGTSQVSYGITWTVNADKTVTANGTKTESLEGFKILDRNTDNYSLPTGKYIFSGNPSNDCQMLLQATRNNQLVMLASLNTADAVAEVDILSTDILQCVLIVNANKTVNNVVFKPMLLTEKQYKLNPAYRPYHASVEDILDVLTTSAADQKTAINAIIAAATGAADFAAFKAAMEAITPISRSLSIQAPDTREASDPEPEVKETKKSTKKSTAKAD